VNLARCVCVVINVVTSGFSNGTGAMTCFTKKKNLQIENGTEVFALYVKEKGHGLHALIHDLRAEVMNY
jgi:ribulose 1,5-bisphosphate carboxylase large subunit-like protein